MQDRADRKLQMRRRIEARQMGEAGQIRAARHQALEGGIAERADFQAKAAFEVPDPFADQRIDAEPGMAAAGGLKTRNPGLFVLRDVEPLPDELLDPDRPAQ